MMNSRMPPAISNASSVNPKAAKRNRPATVLRAEPVGEGDEERERAERVADREDARDDGRGEPDLVRHEPSRRPLARWGARVPDRSKAPRG